MQERDSVAHKFWYLVLIAGLYLWKLRSNNCLKMASSHGSLYNDGPSEHSCIPDAVSEVFTAIALMMEAASVSVWNVGQLLPDYTVQHPRRQPSSYSSPWEPEISQIIHVSSRVRCSKWRKRLSSVFTVLGRPDQFLLSITADSPY
jgi:hypothetical protein